MSYLCNNKKAKRFILSSKLRIMKQKKLQVGDVLTSDSLKETVTKVSPAVAYTERNKFKRTYNHYAIRLSATRSKFDYKFYNVNGQE